MPDGRSPHRSEMLPQPDIRLLLEQLKKRGRPRGDQDDPYHRRRWRDPYPQPEWRKLLRLIAVAQSNDIDFVYGFHPGGWAGYFYGNVNVTGTLSKVDWRNPHIELIVNTKSGEQVQSWSLEGPPPAFFRARDINRSDIESALGKTVTAEASRARDGSRSGLLRVMTLPDGKVVSACPQNC